LSRRQRDLLEEFEKESKAENSPVSTGFFAKMTNFFSDKPGG
jgi:DnaJ-class molecular chaperone